MSNAAPEPLRLYIRKRPGMFVGGTNASGILNLINELVADLLALPGSDPERVHCVLETNGTIAIELRGGTVGAIGAKDFITDSCNYSAANQVLSLAIACAVCDRLEAEVVRSGERWSQTFGVGMPTTPLQTGSTAATPLISIRFRPDPTLFIGGTRAEFLTVCGKARDWAVSRPHTRFRIENEEDGQRRDFYYPAGLLSLAQEIEPNWCGNSRSRVWHCKLSEGSTSAEIVFVVRSSERAYVYLFVNGSMTSGSGSPVEGLRSGLAEVAASFSDHHPDQFALHATNPLRGYTVLLSVQLEDPRYRSATKDVLDNVEARDVIHRMITSQLPDEIARTRIIRNT